MAREGSEAPAERRELSARRIIGFACNQAFVFFLWYMQPDCRVALPGGAYFDRLDLFCTLAFVVVGFAAARTLGPAHIGRLFSRPMLYLYAVIAAAGSLLTTAFPEVPLQSALAQGALVGVPVAYLLTAWGRTFGGQSAHDSVAEVFLGSLVGAFVCLLFSLAPESDVVLVATRLLPFASVVNIAIPADDQAHLPEPVEPERGEVRMLSAKVLWGTLLFGMAAGLLEVQAAATQGAALSFAPIALVLFGAFLIGALTLLLAVEAPQQPSGGEGAARESAASKTNAASAHASANSLRTRTSALNRSYRLAVFLMVFGVLAVPWPVLAASPMPGQALALAGYLGLEAVFVSLFVVIAKIAAIDCALSFSAGFSALFAGELAGTAIANVIGAASASAGTVGPGYAPVVLAGALALLAFVFLFTERDFDELTQIADATESLEDTCGRIASQYGLSKRESEILAFALRGRTNERIAQELVIAKSTVDTHLRRIYQKCGVHSRQELLDLAGR